MRNFNALTNGKNKTFGRTVTHHLKLNPLRKLRVKDQTNKAFFCDLGSAWLLTIFPVFPQGGPCGPVPNHRLKP